MTTRTMTKEQALAEYVAAQPGYDTVTADDVTSSTYGDRTEYALEGYEYLILTDDEADAAVLEYVRESAWAFNASFLAEQTELPEVAFKNLQPLCENANAPILAMIEATCGVEDFTDEAVQADGRGHFLAQYDGDELELPGDLYAYRVN